MNTPQSTSIALGGVNLLTLDMLFTGLPKLPRMGEEVNTQQFSFCLGGGPVASLAVASRLGASTKLATCLGDDEMSQLAKGFLEKEAVSYRNFPARHTTQPPLNITCVMTFQQEDRTFISYFAESDFHRDSIDAKFEYLKDTRFCLASTPSEELFAKLGKEGCRIIYDIGWSDDLCLEDMKAILKHVYLFSPNSKEAMKITGAASPRDALEKLAGYVEQPIVKLGKDGALVWHEQQAVHVPAADFTPVDATGAGDAFLGGVAYGLTQGWDIVRCVELGNYTGGTATTALGCLTARCTLEDYAAYRRQHGR